MQILVSVITFLRSHIVNFMKDRKHGLPYWNSPQYTSNVKLCGDFPCKLLDREEIENQ